MINKLQDSCIRTFMIRLKILKYYMNDFDIYGVDLIKKKILTDLNNLDVSSLSPQDIKYIDEVRLPDFWLKNLDQLDTQFLETKIAPLIKFKKNSNILTEQYTSKCEELYLAILMKDYEQVDTLKQEVLEYIKLLPDNLDSNIKDKKDRILNSDCWKYLSLSDVKMLIEDFSQLMPYIKKGQ